MKKIIVAVAALALMAGSAYAADWNFYGSARISTFYIDADVDGGPDDDTQFEQDLETISRIGAHVKVSDELTGRFEYGAGGGNANIRLLYGEWDFGAGKLLIGQDYVPMVLGGSSQVYDTEAALEGFGGEMWGGRKAQIKLTFGDFQIAFIENDKRYCAGGGAAVTTDVDVIIPMVQVKYAFTAENVVMTMVGGYQTFDIDTAGFDDDVTSWGLGLDVAATFGALKISAQVNGGSNVGNLWLIDVTNLTDRGCGFAAFDGTDIIDNDAIGARIVVGYTFNDMVGVEVGYGYQQTEYDMSGADEMESQSYYIQFPITLAPGVFVVPEVGVVDYTIDDLAGGQEDVTYFGAKWQINF